MSNQQYFENPLLFLNSTGGSVPSGRNVRSQYRTSTHLVPTGKQEGRFGSFNVELKSGNSAAPCANMRKKRRVSRHVVSKEACSLPQPPNGTESTSLRILQDDTPPASHPRLDPLDVLAFATFHIRRLAAATIRANPERLTQVLRCRQWSTVGSFALQRVGKSPCLDSALYCVAAKLRLMTTSTISSLGVLSSYDHALQTLQSALQDSKQHEHVDLLITTQLLAVYEMLESLDNPAWAQHVAGAEILSQPQTPIWSTGQGGQALPFALTVPVFAEALLTGNDGFFESQSWQRSFHAGGVDAALFSHDSLTLVSCFSDLPSLIVDVKLARSGSRRPERATRDRLLDRAHLLRARILAALLSDEQYANRQTDALGSFDKLGLCLAGLIALDRVIASFDPVEPQAQRVAKSKTEELCAQMLQLDLGADEAYPAYDLMNMFRMSTFQQQDGFVIVLCPSGG